MGVNISVRRVIGKELEGTWYGEPFPYYATEDQEWFDSCRYSGDRQFIFETEFYYIDTDLPVEEQRLARPVDFVKTREWVGKNVFNTERLLDALDKMQDDENLCFTWSW